MRGSELKRGPEAFEAHYSELYRERWPQLKGALKQKSEHRAWWNPYWEAPEKNGHAPDPEIEHLVLPDDSADRGIYYLDRASAFCVEALDVSPGHNILDMCAAPGGKSLGIAMKLDGSGHLICNEISASRRGRLKKVMKEFLSPKQLECVEFQAGDGGRYGRSYPGSFDRILLDAPCSSERHLLHNPKEMLRWSRSRSKKISKTQGTLLASAFDALKPGGRLVYSTCSLSDLENDAMIEWLIKKRPNGLSYESINFSMGEKTPFGHIFLPDKACGAGPLYLAVIHKFKGDC